VGGCLGLGLLGARGLLLGLLLLQALREFHGAVMGCGRHGLLRGLFLGLRGAARDKPARCEATKSM